MCSNCVCNYILCIPLVACAVDILEKDVEDGKGGKASDRIRRLTYLTNDKHMINVQSTLFKIQVVISGWCLIVWLSGSSC